MLKDVDVTGLLARWVPNYRAQFWWFVMGSKTSNKRMNEQRRITRPELNKMAKERGMKGYLKLKRFELAERLGIELPKPRRKEERKPRKARRVEVVNPDGTTTVYPSISKAAQALGKYAMQLYPMAVNNEVKFLN